MIKYENKKKKKVKYIKSKQSFFIIINDKSPL